MVLRRCSPPTKDSPLEIVVVDIDEQSSSIEDDKDSNCSQSKISKATDAAISPSSSNNNVNVNNKDKGTLRFPVLNPHKMVKSPPTNRNVLMPLTGSKRTTPRLSSSLNTGIRSSKSIPHTTALNSMSTKTLSDGVLRDTKRDNTENKTFAGKMEQFYVKSELLDSTKFAEEDLDELLFEFRSRANQNMENIEDAPLMLDFDCFKDSMMNSFFSDKLNSQILERFFFLFDIDGDSKLSFHEFTKGMENILKGGLLDHIDFTFDLFDLNGDGFISQNELAKLFRASLDIQDSKNARKIFDAEISKVLVDFATICGSKCKQLSRENFRAACHTQPLLIRVFEDIRDELPKILKVRQDDRVKSRQDELMNFLSTPELADSFRAKFENMVRREEARASSLDALNASLENSPRKNR